MYKLLLSFRYFKSRPVAWFASLAVAVCVFIVLIVLTVYHGLVGTFSEKNHKLVGDCVVSTDSLAGFPYYQEFADKISSLDYVESVSPEISSYGYLNVSGGDGDGFGIKLKGIQLESYSQVTNFSNSLHYKTNSPGVVFDSVRDNYESCVVSVGIWPGSRNSKGEYVFPERMGTFLLVITSFPLTPTGLLSQDVNSKSFTVTDTSESGLAKSDSDTVYVQFDTAQKLCGMGGQVPRTHKLLVKFSEGSNILHCTEKVNLVWRDFVKGKSSEPLDYLLDNVRVEDWRTHRREFIAPMEKELAMLTALFVMLGIVTVFIILVVFYMIIIHKTRDMGILKSLGVSMVNLNVMLQLFALQIGFFGSITGAACGAAFLKYINVIEGWLFKRYGFQIWDRSIYAIGELPDEISMKVLFVIIGSAVLACLFGALIPSVRVSLRKPVDILQVNEL